MSRWPHRPDLLAVSVYKRAATRWLGQVVPGTTLPYVLMIIGPCMFRWPRKLDLIMASTKLQDIMLPKLSADSCTGP